MAIEAEEARARFGYRRLHLLLVREGWKVNHKRIQRTYREERPRRAQDYNRVRPHSALGGLPPRLFRKGAGLQPLKAASAPPVSPAHPGERNAV